MSRLSHLSAKTGSNPIIVTYTLLKKNHIKVGSSAIRKKLKGDKTMVGLQTIRQFLIDAMNGNVLITQIYTVQTQFCGDLDLTGVRVLEVQGDYVLLQQVASPGVGTIVLALSAIVAIDF